MKHRVIVALMVVLALSVTARAASAGCTVQGFERLRNAVMFRCDPYGCPNGRAGFVRCVRSVVGDPALGGPSGCETIVADLFIPSTYCLRSDTAVACHQTFASGREGCRIKRRPEACRAPAGGSACTSPFSCGEACY